MTNAERSVCAQPPFYSQNRNALFDRIRFGRLEFPAYLSANAVSLLTGVRAAVAAVRCVGCICSNTALDLPQLLTRDPHKRLGCGEGDAAEVKKHPFFSFIDWDALLKGRTKPPWKPNVQVRGVAGVRLPPRDTTIGAIGDCSHSRVAAPCDQGSLDVSQFDAEFTNMPLHSPHARVRLSRKCLGEGALTNLHDTCADRGCAAFIVLLGWVQPAGSLEADAVRFENFTFVAPPGFPASKRSPSARPSGSPASGRARAAAAAPGVATVGEGGTGVDDADDADMAVDMDMDDDNIGAGGGAAGAGAGAPHQAVDVGTGGGAGGSALTGQGYGGVRLVPYSHRPPQPPPTHARGATLGPGVSMPRVPPTSDRGGGAPHPTAAPACATGASGAATATTSMWSPTGAGAPVPAFNQQVVGLGWGAPARGGIMGAAVGAGGGGVAGAGAAGVGGFGGPSRGIGFVPHARPAPPQGGFMMSGGAFDQLMQMGPGSGDLAHSLSPGGGDTAMSVSS